MKIAFVDCRVREKELDMLKNFGLEVVLIPKSNEVYEEVSSHTDIFMCKIGKYLVVSNKIYDYVLSKVNKIDKNLSSNIIRGEAKILDCYPNDIPYNACNIGKNVVHNFKYTDKKIVEIMKNLCLEGININQGYSNCSIAVIDEMSAIVSDKTIEKKLKEKGIDVLFIKNCNEIRLLNKGKYSNMSGFIGGTISRIKDSILITGDILNFKEHEKIVQFIESKNLKMVDFKGYDLIDYGGIIVI